MCEGAFCYTVFNDSVGVPVSKNLLDVGEERWTDFMRPLKADMRSSLLNL